MSCFSYRSISLNAGSLHQYNTNLGDPRNLTKETHYSTNTYSTLNYNYAYGVKEYERILAHIETYTGKLDFCPHVNDLAATYNALNEEFGLPGRVMNKAEFLKYADQKDSMVNPQPQGKGAIRAVKSARRSIHQLRGRGVDGGSVFVDVKELKQKIENEKRIAEEQRVQAQLNIELEAIKAEKLRLEQIRINEQKKKDELQRLKDIEIENERRIAEEQRVQRELDREMQEIEAEKIRLEQIEINRSIVETSINIDTSLEDNFHKMPDGLIMENSEMEKPVISTKTVVASSSLITLGIIGLFLYSRTARS